MSDGKKTNARLVGEVNALKKQLERHKKNSKRAREDTKSSQKMLDCLSNAQTLLIRAASPHALFNEILDDLLSLTDSEYGFIGELLFTPEKVPYLKAYATTNIAWNKETRELYEKYALPGMEFRSLNNLFGAVVTTGKPVISNDPPIDPRRGGLPTGHPPLNSFLGLPFYYGKEMVGTVGIANRPGGYDRKLLNYLKPFLSMCANIIESYRIDQHRKLSEEILIKRKAYLEVIAFMGQKLLSCSVGGDKSELDECIYHILGRLGTAAGVDRVYIFENHNGESVDLLSSLRYEWDAKGIKPHSEKPMLQNISYEIDGLSGWVKTMSRRETISGPIRGFPNKEQDTLKMFDVCSLLAVPIFTEQGWWGFLRLDERETEREWDKGEIVLLQSAATTLGQFFNKTRIEAEKTSLQTQLSYSKRMESIGTLAGGIAHNFNNILCGVLGYLSLIKARMDSSNEFYEDICKTEDSAKHAAFLTRKLLEFVQERKPLLKTLGCASIINSSLTLLAGSLKKNITIESLSKCDDFNIMGDEDQIQQIILNLCINAQDAMPDGGTIQIIGKIKKFNVQHLIRGFKIPRGKYLVLQIIDNGTGMSKKTLEHIFEPFFTTKVVGKGTGLGLATVYGTMKNNKGYIDIRSKLRAGTTATLYFPATQTGREPKKK